MIEKYFILPRVTAREAAMTRAKSLCRCIRKSFAGVRWFEAGQEFRLTWDEIDGA